MTGSLDKCADLGWWGLSPWESGGSGWKSGGGAFPLSAPHSWGKMASDCWSDGLSWVATAAVGEGSELLVFAVEGRYSEPEACLGHFCSSRFALQQLKD